MPNLVGCYLPNGTKPDTEAVLARQLRVVRIPGHHYEEYVYASRGFGVGLLDHGILENGPQPVVSHDQRFLLMLDGEILNADELRRQYRHELQESHLTPPELCLRLMAKHGPDVAQEFIGFFVIVWHDRDARSLTLVSDRYAYRPLFYAHREGTLVFGSELKAVRIADPVQSAIDEVGTFELLAYGCHVIDRTWLEGCLRMPPASILSIDPSGCRMREYWRYRYDEQAPVMDQRTYAAAFGTLLDRAVERCMKGSRRIGLFLSGGYDSRSVAAAIRKHHLPVPALTFGLPESRDVRFAIMLAERLGLDHTAVTNGGPYLFRTCRAVVWRTEGLSSFANCTSLRHHRLMKSKMDIILLGFLAEFSGSHTWPRLLLARSRKAAIEAIYQRLLAGRLRRIQPLLNPAFFVRNLEALRSRFQSSFDRVLNDHPMDVADSWQFLYMQPFAGFQTACVDRHQFESRAPHMDFELVRFLLTIPPRARIEQRVYKQMIAYRYPRIRTVPCANSGRPINPHFAQEYVLMVARYLGRKLSEPVQQLVGAAPALGREFRDLHEDFRAETELMHDILTPMLRQGVFPGQIFNLDAIAALADAHYQRGESHADLLSSLISLGLAMRYFLLTETPEMPPGIMEEAMDSGPS